MLLFFKRKEKKTHQVKIINVTRCCYTRSFISICVSFSTKARNFQSADRTLLQVMSELRRQLVTSEFLMRARHLYFRRPSSQTFRSEDIRHDFSFMKAPRDPQKKASCFILGFADRNFSTLDFLPG